MGDDASGNPPNEADELVTVAVLGPLELREGSSVLASGGPTQRRILARLAVQPRRVVSRDALGHAAWGDDPPNSARHTIATHVFRLRRQGLRIEADDDGYRLEAATDAEHFEHLVGEARRVAPDDRKRAVVLLCEAIALWRGTPFAGLDDVDAVRIEAQRLGEVVATAREDLLEFDLDDPMASGVVATAQQLTSDEPYRERRWELLMLALYRAGRQADALEAYAQCRSRLVDELGVEPGPALRRMQHAVLVQDPKLERALTTPAAEELSVAAMAPDRHRVPGASTRLIGRDTEREDLAEAWEHTRLVTLLGPPGAGKTRLAIEAMTSEPGSVWFVALDERTAGQSVSAAAFHVIAAASRSTDATIGLADALDDRHGVLVLDGCDRRSAEVASCAAAVLAACPNIRILATSRERLGLLEEAIIVVGSLPTDDARTLLIDRARLVRPRFEVSAGDTATADRLVETVDGLPLGIELVARHLQFLRLDEVLTRVETDLGRWVGGPVGTSRGLWAAIDSTMIVLTSGERHTLATLAVMAPEATVALIAAVAGTVPNASEEPGPLSGSAVSIDDIFDTVRHLVDMSLVQVRTADGPACYRLLRSVATHTLEVTPSDDIDRIRTNYRRVVIADAGQLAGQLAGANRAATMVHLDRAIHHVRTVLAWMLDRETDRDVARAGLALTVDLRDYWLGRHPAEGLDWLIKLMPIADADDELRADALLSCGHLAYWLTDFVAGRDYLDQARDLYHHLGDALGEGRALRRLGAIAAATDELDESRQLLTASLDCFDRTGIESEIGTTLLHLGSLLADQGLVDQAKPALERSLDIARVGGDPLAVGHALAALTLVHWKAGELASAMDVGEQALKIFVALGHKPTEGTVAYRLASVARCLGHPRVARRYADRAIAAGAQSGTRTTVAFGHLSLARLELDAGEVNAAAEHLREALGSIDHSTDRWVLVELLETTGQLAAMTETGGAEDLLGSAELIRSEIHQPLGPTEIADVEWTRAHLGPQDPRHEPTTDTAIAHQRALSVCTAAIVATRRAGTVRELRR